MTRHFDTVLTDLIWLSALILLIACRPEEIPPPTPIATMPTAASLHIGLTSSATDLAGLVSDPYHQQATQSFVQFIPANNATLFTDLEAGQLDAILVHHIPEGSQHWFNPVALDGLVVVVHPDNPVGNLSRAEVQAIFNGRITHWSTLGGANQPIILVGRERGSGTRAIFTERLMAEQRLAITALIQPDNPSLLTAVANDPAAVGYAMMGSAAGTPILTLDGIAATPATTTAQTYPLTVPLYFVTLAEPTGELRAFLAWLQSENGQAILGEKYGRVR